MFYILIESKYFLGIYSEDYNSFKFFKWFSSSIIFFVGLALNVVGGDCEW